MNISQADVMAIPYASGSFQAVVFSPPYWNLRSYQTGDNKHMELGSEKLHDCLGWATGAPCGKCFICHTVAYMREVKRVLREDGTVWLNCGDSYAGNPSNGRGGEKPAGGIPHRSGREKKGNCLKPKDLCLIPERVALALQADGWYIRAPIIWHKPNPMPGSQTDRPSIDFEFVWLLSKSQHYYFDMYAVTGRKVPRNLV